MADIVINEVSQNYTWNIANSSYATVALPITACWGPGYIEPTITGKTLEESEEAIVWSHFPANQQGLEAFMSTFRGPISNYRLLGDNSYNVAVSLITAGYDILACRVTNGCQAQNKIQIGLASGIAGLADEAGEVGGTTDTEVTPTEPETPPTPGVDTPDIEDTSDPKYLYIKAKYCGTFGNKLRVVLNKVSSGSVNRWNIVTYIVDETGVMSAVENKTFVFEIDNSSDLIPHVEELESNFLELIADPGILDTDELDTDGQNDVILSGGFDRIVEDGNQTVETIMDQAITYAVSRYSDSLGSEEDAKVSQYVLALNDVKDTLTDISRARIIDFREWTYTTTYNVLHTLENKLTYSPQRVIVPGWDDQDICYLKGEDTPIQLTEVSPLHSKLMEVSYYSRCATAYLDIPKSEARQYVYDDSRDNPGYAQMLGRSTLKGDGYDVNSAYFASHSALFAPWAKYTYAGTTKQAEASPSFLALLIDRAMILNQPSQYEWQLPITRKHALKIGKPSYIISDKYLKQWQSLEGVSINCITDIPDMGTSLWGNSTLLEVAPATYQALANLSTRKLVNAVEDLAYRCGIAITFQYNNNDAFQSFYAGMTPLLDTMRNVGAIEDYYIRMSTDIDGLDVVNLNSVVGKIYLSINGVVNNITVDLIALPANVSLDQFRG